MSGGQKEGAAAAEEAAPAVVEKEATDEDPREHLNLVFIGHGKTLRRRAPIEVPLFGHIVSLGLAGLLNPIPSELPSAFYSIIGEIPTLRGWYYGGP